MYVLPKFTAWKFIWCHGLHLTPGIALPLRTKECQECAYILLQVGSSALRSWPPIPRLVYGLAFARPQIGPFGILSMQNSSVALKFPRIKTAWSFLKFFAVYTPSENLGVKQASKFVKCKAAIIMRLYFRLRHANGRFKLLKILELFLC